MKKIAMRRLGDVDHHVGGSRQLGNLRRKLAYLEVFQLIGLHRRRNPTCAVPRSPKRPRRWGKDQTRGSDCFLYISQVRLQFCGLKLLNVQNLLCIDLVACVVIASPEAHPDIGIYEPLEVYALDGIPC